jgi:hypothetical protein
MTYRDRVWACPCGVTVGDGREDVSAEDARAVMGELPRLAGLVPLAKEDGDETLCGFPVDRSPPDLTKLRSV